MYEEGAALCYRAHYDRLRLLAKTGGWGEKKRGRGRGGMGCIGVNITEGAGHDCGTERACGDRDSARLAGDVTTLQNGGGGGREDG